MRDFCAACGSIDKLSPTTVLRVRVRDTGKVIEIHRRCFDRDRHIILSEPG